MEFFNALKGIGFNEIIDVLLMAILIYVVLVWFKRKKAVLILSGIIICGIIYLISYQLNLLLITYVLRAFFAVILIAVIVIFRDELRDLFEQIAVWSIRRSYKGNKIHEGPEQTIDVLVRTLNELAREKIGALIVIKGKNLLSRHLEGGTELNGEISEGILKSIFDPHSEGHDGAVLIEDGKIHLFGTHLPLSKDFSQLKKRGTRHASALGLAEETDALCLVVSEERGKISIAHRGKLNEINDINKLTQSLENFSKQLAPKPIKTSVKDMIKKNYWEKGIAVALALSLWFVLVHEANLTQKSFTVRVQYPELNSNFMVTEINPDRVEITLVGPGNAFHFINEKNIRLSLNLSDVKPGTRLVPISEANISIPKDLAFQKVDPSVIRITIKEEKTDG